MLSELPSGFPAMVSSATEPLPRGDMKTGLLLYRPESNWHRGSNWSTLVGISDLEHALLHVRTQELQPCHAPIDRQGITRLAAATTRARVKVAVRVLIGTRHAIHQGWLSGDGRACWRSCWVRYEDPPSHAARRLRLQVGQRRRRYQDHPGLSRPPASLVSGTAERNTHGLP